MKCQRSFCQAYEKLKDMGCRAATTSSSTVMTRTRLNDSTTASGDSRVHPQYAVVAFAALVLLAYAFRFRRKRLLKET